MSKVVYKEDESFLHFINVKYRKLLGLCEKSNQFRTWDDYAVFLWLKYCKKNDEKYYAMLEEDFKEYADSQQERVRKL